MVEPEQNPPDNNAGFVWIMYNLDNNQHAYAKKVHLQSILEKIKNQTYKNGYNKGYNAGKNNTESHLSNEYNRGYRNGFESGALQSDTLRIQSINQDVITTTSGTEYTVKYSDTRMLHYWHRDQRISIRANNTSFYPYLIYNHTTRETIEAKQY